MFFFPFILRQSRTASTSFFTMYHNLSQFIVRDILGYLEGCTNARARYFKEELKNRGRSIFSA